MPNGLPDVTQPLYLLDYNLPEEQVAGQWPRFFEYLQQGKDQAIHATAHNVYLMLYPKGPLRDILRERPELEGEIFEKLQNISPETFISEGRVYGGGLHKVEPKELAKVPAGFLIQGLDHVLHRGQQLTMLMT
ncbi:MAG: hypothetical protein ABSA39_21775 [Edaphobacter sp.]